MLLASPQHSEAVVNSTTAPMKTFFRPYMSLIVPAVGIATICPSA